MEEIKPLSTSDAVSLTKFKPLTPGELTMLKVIEVVLEAGYLADGETKTETVRYISEASYPFAGKEVSLGGRQRFHLPETDKYVTVGKLITYFYIKKNDEITMQVNYKTKELDKIKDFLS